MEQDILGEQHFVYETDEEEFSGRQETALHDQMAYETDEEEFLGTGDTDASPVILTHYATLEHTRGPVKIENTAKRDLSVQRRGRKSNTHTHGYNLSYFNLWWWMGGSMPRRGRGWRRRGSEDRGE